METSSASVVSVETAVAKLATVAHVVEVKAPYVLVHASPNGLAGIIGLGYSVSPSKRGPEYYAVKVAGSSKPGPANDTTAPSAPPAPVSETRVSAPATKAASTINIKGETYEITETPTKRKVDVRRWELSKGDGSKPYVTTFQAHDGTMTACSCKGGIFHKHCKHMDALRAAFGKKSAAA